MSTGPALTSSQFVKNIMRYGAKPALWMIAIAALAALMVFMRPPPAPGGRMKLY